MPVVLTLFVFLLGLVVHNVVRFMWLSDYLRNLNVAYFYLLVFIACCFRCACFVIIMIITYEGASQGTKGEFPSAS